MSIIFPFLAFALIYFAAYRRERNWRVALLVAAILWGMFVTLITESLSLFRLIDVWPIAVSWAIVSGAAGVWVYFKWSKAPNSTCSVASAGPFDWKPATMCGLLSLMLTLLGCVAIAAAPNTYDAMTYHLSRVLHWVQNHHVGHYPTSIQRQIHLAPWAGYAILQFHALTDSDRFTNGVQWFALVVAVVGASLIARQLGANAIGQALAAVLVGTAPMAVLQATSPQNDLVVACWIVCAVWFMLRAMNSDGKAMKCSLALAGLALGHAILTKATAYLFGFPFCFWLLIVMIRRFRSQAMAPLAIFGCLVIATNLPTYVRQMQTYGSPLGLIQETGDSGSVDVRYVSDLHMPAAILSNLVRTTALQLGTPWLAETSALERAVSQVHPWIGLAVNDPRTTWPNMSFHVPSNRWCDENFAGNPLHFLLIVAAITIVMIRRRSTPSIYALAVVCGFVLFSAVLRWNIWMSRLVLPLLILALPLVSIAFQGILREWMSMLIAVVAIALAVPVTLFNISRPLVGEAAHDFWQNRQVQYSFGMNHAMSVHQINMQIVERAMKGKCDSIGLRFGFNDAEYPLWMAFRARGLRPRIEHVGVTNPSGKYYSAIPPFDPDVTITHHIKEGTMTIEHSDGTK